MSSIIIKRQRILSESCAESNSCMICGTLSNVTYDTVAYFNCRSKVDSASLDTVGLFEV